MIVQLSPDGRFAGHASCTDALPETDTWIFSSGAGMGLLNVKNARALCAGISEAGPAAWWTPREMAATGVLRKTAKFPASILVVKLTAAKSGLPSELKSPTARPVENAPVRRAEEGRQGWKPALYDSQQESQSHRTLRQHRPRHNIGMGCRSFLGSWYPYICTGLQAPSYKRPIVTLLSHFPGSLLFFLRMA